MVKISASVLSADFSRLGLELSFVSQYVDEFHLDVMDGHFVPNISFGSDVVKAVRKLTNLPLDVHLMIKEPLGHIPSFVDAGVDTITFHYETADYFKNKNYYFKCRDLIKNKGAKVGVAYNPDTPVLFLDPNIDRVLIMSVYPGFAGQKFIKNALKKVSEVRQKIDKNNYNIEIAVDGGIKVGPAYDVVKHGADVVVAGSAVFKGSDIKKNIFDLKKDINRWKGKRL